MFLIQLIKKILFDRDTDRIGPDIPFTHYKLPVGGINSLKNVRK